MSVPSSGGVARLEVTSSLGEEGLGLPLPWQMLPQWSLLSSDCSPQAQSFTEAETATFPANATQPSKRSWCYWSLSYLQLCESGRGCAAAGCRTGCSGPWRPSAHPCPLPVVAFGCRTTPTAVRKHRRSRGVLKGQT